jgi:hypothetical protein
MEEQPGCRDVAGLWELEHEALGSIKFEEILD